MTRIWKCTENSRHLVSLFNTIRTKDRALNVNRKCKGQRRESETSLNTPEWEAEYREITRDTCLRCLRVACRVPSR